MQLGDQDAYYRGKRHICNIHPAASKMTSHIGFFAQILHRLVAMVHEHSCVLTLWSPETNAFYTKWFYGTTLSKVQWSPDGTYLAISSKK